MAQKAGILEPLKGLTEEERKAADQLKRDLGDTAQKLQENEKATPREVLDELDRRARDAEKLADSLTGKDAGLSSDMLAELERHADTADFASAIRAGELDKAADEAR